MSAMQQAKKLMAAASVLKVVKGLYAPRFVQCEPFKSVAYGKPAILELDQSAAYATLEIVTNLPVSRIHRISFEYQDGSEFSSFSPEFLHARDKYNDLKVLDSAETGVNKSRLYLDFCDDQLRTTDGIRRGELVVLPGEVIRMKVHLSPKQSGDPETIEMYANARKLDAQADRYFVSRLSEMVVSHTVSGEQTHKFPLMGINHRIRRMWLQTDNLEYFEIIRDRIKVLWGDVDDYNAMTERLTGKKVPDGWVCIDFIQHGFASESAFLPVANESLQLKLRTIAAQEIPVVFEYITQNKEIPIGN